MGRTLREAQSSFSEDLVEETEHFRHVELHVLKVQQMLIVLLLYTRGHLGQQTEGT